MSCQEPYRAGPVRLSCAHEPCPSELIRQSMIYIYKYIMQHTASYVYLPSFPKYWDKQMVI